MTQHADFVGSNVQATAVQPCPVLLMDRVGASEVGCQRASTRPYPSVDDELELHIEDAHYQYRTAYERFELHGCPHDRDEALLHLHRMNAALLARSPEALAARHAAFEQRISQGVDFFNSEYASQLARGCVATQEGHVA